MGPSFVSLGKRDRDHVLADWDEGPRVQPANATHCVSFRGSREGEELRALGLAGRKRSWESGVSREGEELVALGRAGVGAGKGEEQGVLD